MHARSQLTAAILTQRRLHIVGWIKVLCDWVPPPRHNLSTTKIKEKPRSRCSLPPATAGNGSVKHKMDAWGYHLHPTELWPYIPGVVINPELSAHWHIKHDEHSTLCDEDAKGSIDEHDRVSRPQSTRTTGQEGNRTVVSLQARGTLFCKFLFRFTHTHI